MPNGATGTTRPPSYPQNKHNRGPRCSMKLRIKGNSIRLRLGQSDIRRLAIEGTVEESTTFGPFPNERFSYILFASPHEPAIHASYTDRRMVIRVPRKLIDQWITTDQVGINATQRIGDY